MAFGGKFDDRDGDDVASDINVTPMVDVMLVLLVIILTTASFMTTGNIRVDLPKTASAQALPKISLQLELAHDGTIRLDDIPVSMDELKTALSGKNPESAIMISADRDVTLQPFISLIDALKKEGFNHISVQTRQ